MKLFRVAQFRPTNLRTRIFYSGVRVAPCAWRWIFRYVSYSHEYHRHAARSQGHWLGWLIGFYVNEMEHPSHSPNRKIGINPTSLIIRRRMEPPIARVPERERCFIVYVSRAVSFWTDPL